MNFVDIFCPCAAGMTLLHALVHIISRRKGQEVRCGCSIDCRLVGLHADGIPLGPGQQVGACELPEVDALYSVSWNFGWKLFTTFLMTCQARYSFSPGLLS